MPNYKETPVTGTQWQRCNQVVIDNPFNGLPSIRMAEEQIVTLNGDQFSRTATGMTFPFNPAEEFPLINPSTGESLGQTMSCMQLYVALASLYAAKALERDTPPVVDDPVVVSEPEIVPAE